MIKNSDFLACHAYLLGHFPDIFSEADEYEAIGITLCIIPIIQPDLPEAILKKEFGDDGDFPLFGGLKGVQHRGILPTGETWLYFCCGNDLSQRIDFIQKIPNYLSHPESLLNIELAPDGEPFLSGRLVLSNRFRKQFQHLNLIYAKRISHLILGNFLETTLEFRDLILPESVMAAIDEIKYWQSFYSLGYHKDVEFLKRIRQGLKILFTGKSGTGKTQVSAIIGKSLNLEVYRIDLSQVVSKYIGETEKNLSKVFEMAETKNWILFFDEGDALFGKRTSVNSSNDRYANQEVAYLLQRMEDYPGIIILSSNMKENIDTAFLRRFQIVTEFPMPDQSQRLQIWKKLIGEVSKCEVELDENDYEEIAKTELSGGAITNIVNYALMKSCYLCTPIRTALIKEGIIRELRKENRLTSVGNI